MLRLESFSKESNEIGIFAKKGSCKRGAVDAKSSDSIDMTLALLEDLFGGLRVLNNRLESKGTNLYKTCHCLKVFLGGLGGNQRSFFEVSKLI